MKYVINNGKSRIQGLIEEGGALGKIAWIQTDRGMIEVNDGRLVLNGDDITATADYGDFAYAIGFDHVPAVGEGLAAIIEMSRPADVSIPDETILQAARTLGMRILLPAPHFNAVRIGLEEGDDMEIRGLPFIFSWRRSYEGTSLVWIPVLINKGGWEGFLLNGEIRDRLLPLLTAPEEVRVSLPEITVEPLLPAYTQVGGYSTDGVFAYAPRMFRSEAMREHRRFQQQFGADMRVWQAAAQAVVSRDGDGVLVEWNDFVVRFHGRQIVAVTNRGEAMDLPTLEREQWEILPIARRAMEESRFLI